eukprot:SAG11_NODE_119_length_15911_cov_7.077599_6_plen_187_part_00
MPLVFCFISIAPGLLCIVFIIPLKHCTFLVLNYLLNMYHCDGDRWGHVEQRMAKATAAFGRLGHIWRDASLSRGLKLRIYSTYVVSVLAWGVQAWPFGEKQRKKLRQWNAKMLVRLMGTAKEEEDWGAAVRTQHRNPEVDLVGILRSRRMKWLGHVLRMPETKLIRRIMLRHEAPYDRNLVGPGCT